MKLGPVAYDRAPPAGYRCAFCGAHGCKLWWTCSSCGVTEPMGAADA